MASTERRSGVSMVTLGRKGVSLSPASLFAVASGSAEVVIDSSALSKLSDSPPTAKFSSLPLNDLTLEEARAFFSLTLHKLLLSGTGIRRSLVESICRALNANPSSSSSETLGFDDSIDVTENELLILSNQLYISVAIAGVVDYQALALSTVADSVAALSCEALGASPADFKSADSGDGGSSAGVARDLRVFLNNGSVGKGKGKVQSGAVFDIPEIHGALRDSYRSVHSMTRAELNSPVSEPRKGKGLASAFLYFASAIRNMGENSLSRAELNIDAMSNEGFKSRLIELLEEDCPKFTELMELSKSLSQLELENDYVKFFYQLNSLFKRVWKIVSWEAVTAFVSIEGGEIVDKPQASGGDSENPKKKKKKKVLGEGNRILVQFIKDKLQGGVSEAVDSSAPLEKRGRGLLALLDIKDPSFPDLLSKVKEIVESNGNRRLPKIPKGTREFSGEQSTIRGKAFSIIEDVFKRHGATALHTPAFELRETLMGQYGEDSKLIYDLEDQGGERCSLRYDLTVPFARHVAMNGLDSFKRYQIAQVYRRDNPSKGRYREFYQCDFDIAGQFKSMGPDFEVLKIMTELLDELEIGDYEIKLNHRKLLDGMLEICGVPPGKFREVCSSIDKLDKQPFEVIRREMVKEKGLSDETADTIGTFVRERGPPFEVLSKLKQDRRFLGNKGSTDAFKELEILFEALESSKCINKVVFDLSLARGLAYYTGVIFEAVLKGGDTEIGSIAGGGRYDDLIGMFGGKRVPAVGVSLGIERVFTILEKKQTARASETQVLVGVLGEIKLSVTTQLLSELWDARIKAEWMVDKKPMSFIKTAKSSGIPWLVIVGDREIKEKTVNLKNIETATQETIDRDKVVKELQRRLKQTNT